MKKIYAYLLSAACLMAAQQSERIEDTQLLSTPHQMLRDNLMYNEYGRRKFCELHYSVACIAWMDWWERFHRCCIMHEEVIERAIFELYNGLAVSGRASLLPTLRQLS